MKENFQQTLAESRSLALDIIDKTGLAPDVGAWIVEEGTMGSYDTRLKQDLSETDFKQLQIYLSAIQRLKQDIKQMERDANLRGFIDSIPECATFIIAPDKIGVYYGQSDDIGLMLYTDKKQIAVLRGEARKAADQIAARFGYQVLNP